MTLYPAIEPYAQGMLPVGDGQQIYWEECGNPDGKPAVFLHGGPGRGLVAGGPAAVRPRRLPARAAGPARLRPQHAARERARRRPEQQHHLASGRGSGALRTDRGIDRWLVFGGSWGSALALAYAEQHPQRVSELVLRGIFTLRRSELDFYYNGGAGQLFPERYEMFLAPLGGRSFRGDAIAAYHDLLFDPDPAVHGPAGVAWTSWEAATITLEPNAQLIAQFSEPAYALAFARIENHYFVHGGWFARGSADRGRGACSRDIPAVIVQGRYDVATPAVTAYELHLAWPEADFTVAPLAGSRLLRGRDRRGSGPGDGSLSVGCWRMWLSKMSLDSFPFICEEPTE